MKFEKLFLVFFVVGGLLSTQSFAQKNCDEPRKTTEGMVKGTEEKGACAWKGIPYAEPPVGELRWRRTRPAKPRSELFDAKEYGPSCPQKESFTSGGEVKSMSEDCLNLNIWAPKAEGVFPVMVWLHGGAFKQGSGTYEMYNGARLAGERGVIVVTINYRIGNLGFLALPELAQEDPDRSSGNYGIFDQIQALKWIKENIFSFGGDPNNITLFGQSAGGISICSLLVSPLANGLFDKAIIQSGPCDMVAKMEDGFKKGREVAERVGCRGPDLVNCLRQKPAEEFVTKTENVFLNLGVVNSPHIDGYVIPDEPLKLLKEGKFHNVPLIVGHTRDELKAYTLMIPGLSLLSRSTINLLGKKLLGNKAQEIFDMYSYSNYKHPIGLFYAVAIDASFASRAFIVAEATSKKSPVYLYRFDFDDTRFKNKAGAFHGLEIPLVFGALDLDFKLAKMLTNKKVLKLGTPLSERMMSYWTNFAKTGNPNGEGLPEWAPYSSEERVRIVFDTEISSSKLSEDELKRYRYFEEHNLQELAKERTKKR